MTGATPSVLRRLGSLLGVACAAALVTALLHELGHWAMGTVLGNEMTLSLNAATPIGAYREPWHEHLVSAAGPLVTIVQAVILYYLVTKTGEPTLMPFLVTAFVYRAMAAGMNVVNPNDEGRLSTWLGLNIYVLPAIVTAVLLWLVVDAARRTGYGAARGLVAVVVAVHLLGLLVLADQMWSIRLL